MADQDNIHRNSFDGGLNADLNKNISNPTQYLEAKNVTLVNNGNFLVLENVKGTTLVSNLISSTATTTVLGAFASKYKIGDVYDVNCITVFTHEEDTVADNNIFRIQAINSSTGTVYNLYQETVLNNYLVNANDGNERVIDSVLYPENGIDILYFSDYYFGVRKLRCEIPASYAGTPFLSSLDLKLLKSQALGTIALNNITTGGSLLTGSYQVAYQLYNSNTNKYTGYSLLTNPIHIYTDVGLTTSASIGTLSKKKIVLSVSPTEDELAYFTHFRLAIIENIGTGVLTTNVGVTKLEPIANRTNYEIKSNQQYEFVTLDDIVIDLAAIEKIKTLTIRDNRMLFGNTILASLTYDNGTPVITGGSIVQQVATGSETSDLFQSLYKGHFRDEVYRYAISYFDNSGNFSAPKTLNLSNVTHNQISGATDMKFPSRSFNAGGTYYTIMDTNNRMRNLGLQLTGITGHPSWAKGFVILRAKRKKNIEFQTPLIPMVKLAGIGAVANYPTEYREGASLTTVTDTTLAPMGPSEVFVPYNLFYGAPAASPKVLKTSGGTGLNTYVEGESAPLQYQNYAEFTMLFPPKTIYEKTSHPFTGAEQLQVVDAALCEAFTNRFDSESYTPGFGANTSISSTFFSVRDTLQYFNHGHSKSASGLRSGLTVPLQNVTTFDNGDEGRKLSGADINDFSKLSTSGVVFGSLPSNQRSAVGSFNQTVINSVITPPAFAGGTPTVKVNNSRGTLSYVLGDSEFQQTTSGIWEVPFVSNLGTWNVVTNTPSLVDGVGTLGSQYTVIGITPSGDPFVRNLGSGNITFYNGDYIRYNGSRWVSNREGFKKYSNIIEINNVVNGLDDSRYGAENDYNEFIYTGTKVVFTNSEVTTSIQQKTPLPKTVTIWGGDCVISPHFFKISDSTYTIVNQSKYEGTGSPLATLGANWQKVWLNSTDAAGLALPIFFKNAAQYLSVVLESEYNGAVVDKTDQDYVYTTDGGASIDIYGAPTEPRARLSSAYAYNINLNQQNDQKLFLPIDDLVDVTTKYKSRVYYSDLKIYQTDIQGFDTVRVSNFVDLLETYGPLTKLSNTADRLYALQTNGIAILPIGERVIETTDTSQLAVRSGEFLGSPVYIDSLRGCQHLGSVVNNGRTLYFLDGVNKAVCSIDGGVQVLSGNGLSTISRALFDTPIIDRAIIGAYDIVRDQYWIVKKVGSNRFAYIWNEGLKKWESDIVFPEFGFGAAVASNSKFFIIGKDTTTNFTSVHTMHTGNYSQFMGTYSQPSVTFISNPMPDVTKVFDALLVNTSAPINTLTGQVTTERAGVAQLGLTTPFDTQRGEGNYKVKIGRNTLGSQDSDLAYIERLRGPYASIKLLWGYDTSTTRTTPVSISSVLTKYRPSFNIF